MTFIESVEILGEGSPRNPGNIALLDWQPDGAIDISGGIAALRFLFLGGPPHCLAVLGRELEGCVAIFGCPDLFPCR